MIPENRWSLLRLEADGLTCERGGRRVLTDLSFHVASGRLLAVRGPNGAGKSTLLRLLAGLLRPERGTIMLTGDDEGEPVWFNCHYVGHSDALKSVLTVREILALWGALLGPGSSSHLAALEAFDVGHLIDLPAGYLSAGQRRRVGLSRLLLSDRPIWLLDEPTSTLDAASEAKLDAVMTGHLQRGGIILAATHLDLPVEAGRLDVLEVRPATLERMDAFDDVAGDDYFA